MRYYRIVLFCSLVFLVVAPISGEPNQQKIYSLDDDVYEAIETLYICEGLSLPSTTGPYSQAELTLMLEKIDSSALEGSMQDTYKYVQTILGLKPKIQGKGIGLSWGFDATLETYTHHDTTNFIGRETWNYDAIHHKPLLTVSLETWPASSFYGYSELSVGNTYILTNDFGSMRFATNILAVPPAAPADIDLNIPYRAFVAAGGDHWSLQVGRDRLNWGAGHTGNLMVSDSFKYHNMARMTTFSDKFKFTFVTSFFPHPNQYYEETGVELTGHSQSDEIDGIYMFMSHRLEGRLFKERIGISLTESIVYQSEENLLDLRILNPATIFHDYYIRSNANSILGLELDYTPLKGLNIYAQAAVDEFAIPLTEPVPGGDKEAFPSAFGYLAGIEAVVPISCAVGYGSLEFAYTDPYLYLRYATKDGQSPGSPPTEEYGLNYVAAIRDFSDAGGVAYHPEFIGYTYGNDALVVNLNGGVKSYGKWNLSGNVFYMAHGTFDMFTIWSRVGGDEGAPLVTTPTDDGSDALGNYADLAFASRNAVSHTLVAGVYGSYQITDSLRTFGQLDYITIKNYKNMADQEASDVQLTFGLSYTI